MLVQVAVHKQVFDVLLNLGDELVRVGVLLDELEQVHLEGEAELGGVELAYEYEGEQGLDWLQLLHEQLCLLERVELKFE